DPPIALLLADIPFQRSEKMNVAMHSRDFVKRAILSGSVIIAALLAVSCQTDPSSWYPKG
ncbi:MAG: hypothetical protein Q8M76_07725, partial [Spirochaetaceae bacterium]|nr:hypothetical protein [Spirochaetaceae bacterium]